MIKVLSVKPQGGHKLMVSFSDGTSGVADMSRHVKREPFASLARAESFRGAIVEHGAVEWPEARVGIATEALYALVHGLPRPKTVREVKSNELAVGLRELRKAAGATQVAVAAKVGWTQGALSLFESGGDHKISTLKKYVSALGGKLEVVAVVGGKRVQIHSAPESKSAIRHKSEGLGKRTIGKAKASRRPADV